MDDIVLEVNNLNFSYISNNKRFKVIDEVSFSLTKGSVLGVLGPSGCGKSTLLGCISGLFTPQDGYILIKDKAPIQAQSFKNIGISFQEDCLLSWLSVRENILLPNEIGNKVGNSSFDYSKIIDIIGLRDFENYYPDQLSGGMKQRVSLARALITNPELLLLDEPFSSIDLLTRTNLMIEFHKIIRQLKLTVVIVTHSIEEAVFMSDQLIVLESIPTKIKKRYSITFDSDRSFDLMNDPKYLEIVNSCRNLLLQAQTHED